MNVYEQAERELSEAREAFSSAFGGTENAVVIKSQRNDFALRFKYPLLMLVCAVIVAAVVVIQVVFRQFDALYIVCECIICLAMAACIVLFAITWHITRRNARAAEAITYYSPEPGKRFLYTEIAGGGEKIEWADACLYLLDHYDGNDFFNVGYGKEVTILELAQLIRKVTGYEGEIVLDPSKPDGTPRKLTDISRLKAAGWEPKIDLETGLKQTYEWFCARYETGDFAQR